MKYCVFIFILFSFLCNMCYAQKESSLLKDEVLGFGFPDDPLLNVGLTYTSLTFNDLFISGPCDFTPHSAPVYGPVWRFSNKVSGVPVHSWGISYDTLLSLFNQTDINNYNNNPSLYAQIRFVQGRVKGWEDYTPVGYFEIFNITNPSSGEGWAVDGGEPGSGAYIADSLIAFARKSNIGEFFNYDHPSISDSALWVDGADIVVQYGNFIVDFYELVNDQYSQIPNLQLAFQVRNQLCYNYSRIPCPSGFTGNAEVEIFSSGSALPVIADWTSPPLSCNP